MLCKSCSCSLSTETPVLGVDVHGCEVNVRQAQDGAGVLAVADAGGREEHCVQKLCCVHVCGVL